ncbi:MAG: formate--tetrahydrofolate ligase [Ignavibacteriaceae bacterium]|nr:formate--tetrahydrofolate ligase [Ignavibacterium sp.]MCC6254085.1 formate--tetrahydrofolate ligase [Ignavibacteriaceae bacterium]HRN26248.1 formate--tetrahydrofolate ligase [Ignavibacteriaceae bacterium]HRP91915.1 formate--tetrahydrofolate ligase [Ignavibacteriaceae bacterium]HRQ53832.1 formate--tetrahydrofolate ligase [Ignavibacteriaceae bacterium]
MPTDQEIASKVKLTNISNLLDQLEIEEDDFEFYGKYTGKIKLNVLEKFASRPDGKLILVTAMSPTNFGEGKTLTTIGLGQALNRIGKKGIIAIREPSVGPVFGIKGGAAGGGHSQVLPMEMINLHFNGDLNAISTAHNLLAAMIDNHILKGNDLGIDVTNILWNRTMDMNDRSLRQIVVGLGGRVNGIPRESGFVITAASEVMAILALADSRADLKRRLGEIAIGYSYDKKLIKAKDLQAHKAMAVLLNDAIMPNLVQTSEYTPALVHAGPFANIAHGTNSIIADKIALKLADYVVTECGFGADLGAEKFFDIVCRNSSMWPSVVVIVATCRAIKFHGGVSAKPEQLLYEENPEAFKKGLENLEVHINNMKKFGVPAVVAINKFPKDTASEIKMIFDLCKKLNVECAEHEAFLKGGEGAIELAKKTVSLADANKNTDKKFIYELEIPIEEKIKKIATEIYGADDVHFEKRAKLKIEKFTQMGYGKIPICIAKTQMSLSDNPRMVGMPKDWTLTVTDANLSAGAGFIVIVCGDMMLMPGLPKIPAAVNMDVDENGTITGLF